MLQMSDQNCTNYSDDFELTRRLRNLFVVGWLHLHKKTDCVRFYFTGEKYFLLAIFPKYFKVYSAQMYVFSNVLFIAVSLSNSI